MRVISLDVGHVPTPTIHRTDDELAKRYGFESVNAFADSFQVDETVLDVGASLSTLGHTVTRLRSDIEWVNMDIAYGDPTDVDFYNIYTSLRNRSPENLRYVAGNILNPPSELRARRFGRVLCFWVLPHLVRRSHRQGLVAVNNMFALGKPGGILNIGPLRSERDDAGSFTIPDTIEEAAKLADKITKPWVIESDVSRAKL